MTYTVLAALAVVLTVTVDQLVARTRLTSSRAWWIAYAVVVVFQLATNGWLTGRGIVRYDAAAIVGNAHISFLGDGRVAWAPVEDLGFGFALVLFTCTVWVLTGRPRRPGENDG